MVYTPQTDLPIYICTYIRKRVIDGSYFALKLKIIIRTTEFIREGIFSLYVGDAKTVYIYGGVCDTEWTKKVIINTYVAFILFFILFYRTNNNNNNCRLDG